MTSGIPTAVPLVGSVGIVADDLTGASDSAVQFARSGWRTRLTLAASSLAAPVAAVRARGTSATGHGEERGSRSVLAVVTDSRAQDGDRARAGTAEAVRALAEAGVDRLFLKIDSTMRGSVSDQIAGALTAWSATHPGAFAVVSPAYPAMGRTLSEGRVLVHGAHVHTTAIGTDPVTPVLTSVLAELLPGSVAVTLAPGSAADHAEQITRVVDGGARVLVLDATTDAHLHTIADAVAHLGPRAVPVGAAGLAVAMSAVWAVGAETDAVPPPPPPAPAAAARVIVVVSSLHDVSRGQHACLVESLPEAAVRAFAPPLDVFLRTGGIIEWVARELDAAPQLPGVIIVAAPSERPAALESGSAPAGETTAMAIADGLATLTAAVFDHQPVGALVLMGGEGARAVLDRFDAASVLVTDAIREGIPIGVIEGGRAHGLTVVTKAGGFGTPGSIAEIVPELLVASVSGQPTTRTLGETP